MITFSRFGKHGNLGNQLFQWAGIAGLCRTHGKEFGMPSWKYASSFQTPPPVTAIGKSQATITEKNFHFDPQQWDLAFKRSSFGGGQVDILGWLQCEKYWNSDQAWIQGLMKFKQSLIDQVKSNHKALTSVPEVIAISVRRGDYVNNPNYMQLDINYYLSALLKHFPKYHKRYNIIVFSDDMEYCQLHFAGVKNVTYAKGGPIEQLAAMSLCKHFIIANSTFSWWGAYLGEKRGSKVIRPDGLFAGDMKDNNNSCDFYPSRWITHKEERIDLSDVTFMIPYKRDHQDREDNLRLSISMIRKHFHTQVIIFEQNGRTTGGIGESYIYNDDLKVFHRTFMLNEMCNKTITKIIVNWDADVIVPPAQIYESVRRIRDDEADMVYPYDGRFARVTRDNFNNVYSSQDIGCLAGKMFKGMIPGDRKSVGGALVMKKEAFIAAGMENENFISYGPEDVERLYRFEMLGFRVAKTKGVLYHMDHYIGQDSGSDHPYFKGNEAELLRIQRMNQAKLKAEIAKWKWVTHYTAEYYETIFENAIQSRDEIFKVLIDLGLLKPGMKVLDVGCGIGEFGYEAAKKFAIDYYGVDYKIPMEKLLIQSEKYKEYDLTSGKPFPIEDKFDLVICTEVLEHIEEQYADNAIALLTSLGDNVLFSAAIPNQGGLNHINEQWQTYWTSIFARNDFFGYQKIMMDDLWDNEKVDVWYRQNLVLYSRNELPFNTEVMAVVHPVMFKNVISTLQANAKS